MVRFDRVLSRAIVAAGLLLLITAYFSCIKPPSEDIDHAEAAMAAVRDSEAGLYAPEELKSAEELLVRMRSEMEDGAYRDAESSAGKCVEAAEVTMSVTRQNRDRARSEAEGIIASVRESLAAAAEMRADLYATAAYGDGIKVLDEAVRAFDAGDYHLAAEKGYFALGKAEAAIERSSVEVEAKPVRIAVQISPEVDGAGIDDGSAEDLMTMHSIRKGECLWGISGYETVYSDPFMWPLIFQANRDRIERPDLIYPGQALAIPRTSTPEEIRHARKAAGAPHPYLPPFEAVLPYLRRHV